MWLLALLLSTPAGFTGADLVKVCTASAPLCDAYLVGFMDGHALSERRAFCLPTDEIKVELVRGHVREYLAQTDQSLPASGLVANALMRAYPCGKKARE